MDIIREFCLVLFTATIVKCVSLQEQIDHIARRKQESNGGLDAIPQRRFVSNPMYPKILGVPTNFEQLPRAEPILPGRTLLLPEFGMLKSAVMFPHKENEDGAGVYGHINKLGIKYDGRDERVVYSQFRRNIDDDDDDDDDKNQLSELSSSGSSSEEDGHIAHMMKRYKKILTDAVNRLQRRRSQNVRISNTNPFNIGLQIKPDKSKSLLNTLQKLKLINEKKLKMAGVQISDYQQAYDSNDSKEQNSDLPISGEVQFGIKKPKGYADLQMTGDHFNLNSNAPEYNDVIPLEEIEKDEPTPWIFLCELQEVPY